MGFSIVNYKPSSHWGTPMAMETPHFSLGITIYHHSWNLHRFPLWWSISPQKSPIPPKWMVDFMEDRTEIDGFVGTKTRISNDSPVARPRRGRISKRLFRALPKWLTSFEPNRTGGWIMTKSTKLGHGMPWDAGRMPWDAMGQTIWFHLLGVLVYFFFSVYV